MAEPLLKRTFSRLRGNRARRKTTGGKSEAVTQNPSSSSSSSSPSLPLTTSVRDSNPSPPRTHITVAKKQQWAKQASVGRGDPRDPRDNPHTPPSSPDAPGPASRHPGWERGSPVAPGPTSRHPGWERSSGNAQAPSTGPPGNQRRSSHDKEEEPAERNPVGLEDSDQHVAPCLPSGATAALHDASTPTGDRQGAYLQSLDRSSRAWVLSSGKAQAPDQASASSRPQGEHNIWYNPIPEEDDSASAARREEESVWKRRRDQEVGGATREALASDCPIRAPQRGPGGGATADCPIGAPQRGPGGGATAAGAGQKDRQGKESPKGGASPNIRPRPPDDIITPEHTELVQCEAPPPDSSPSSQKKGGVSGSVIDRLRSPGTVRRLSLKMKKLPELRRKLSLRSHRNKEAAKDQSESTSSSSSDQNVISRYHLDSSAPPVRPLRKSSRGRSAGKGGYLSDGDSPELLPRQQQAPPPSSMPGGGCDVTSFRLYVGSEQPRCAKRVTGLLTVHLMGLDDMMDRADRQVFVAIQIDGVTRARTALLPLRGSALSLNHAFHLELERARQLRLIVLTPTVCPQGLVGVTAPGTNQSHTSSSGSPAPSSCGPTRNRVCGLGGVCIPPLFKACRGQQLCVKLEPRGLLYIKLSLQEQWDTPTILPKCSSDASSSVFGVELHLLVEREGSASTVPILIQKAVEEIERRGLKVVGLYRLCGSAAVKKELRDWFERNSTAVSLSEELYPDINVVTGILKDYLRELPSPLITRTLYQVVLEAMTLRPPPNPVVTLTSDPELCRSTVSLLDCLPPPEKATLSLLLDHLSLVSSLSHVNRMTHQNLAVCFGPVLLWGGGANQPTSQSGGGGRGLDHGEGGVASAVDFKRHIEALHYLLQLWPVPVGQPAHRDEPLPSPPPSPPPPLITHNPTGQQRRAALRLALPPPEEAVVSRRGRGRPARLDSSPPINRYAGDWSVCGRDFLSGQEADYDEVAGSESEGGSDEDEEEEEQKKEGWTSYVDDFLDFDAPFSCRLSLKDFDALIHDLDRELLNICL